MLQLFSTVLGGLIGGIAGPFLFLLLVALFEPYEVEGGWLFFASGMPLGSVLGMLAGGCVGAKLGSRPQAYGQNRQNG
jgi:hypothetical protein